MKRVLQSQLMPLPLPAHASAAWQTPPSEPGFEPGSAPGLEPPGTVDASEPPPEGAEHAPRATTAHSDTSILAHDDVKTRFERKSSSSRGFVWSGERERSRRDQLRALPASTREQVASGPNSD